MDEFSYLLVSAQVIAFASPKGQRQQDVVLYLSLAKVYLRQELSTW